MSQYITNKDQMNYKSLDSLQPVHKIISEAGEALKDPTRNIETSAISDVLAGVGGFTIGSAASVGGVLTLAASGTSGAAALTSGLAAMGSVVGGGMLAGIAVAAAPAAILAGGFIWLSTNSRNKKLMDAKKICYQEAIKKQSAISNELARRCKDLESGRSVDKKRIEYLNKLNIVMQEAIKNLKHDLGY